MKLLCTLLACVALVATTCAAPNDGATIKNIEYGRGGGERLLLDAHVPDGAGPFPVAILVHGGGWSSGDKSGSNFPGDGADITPWFKLFSDLHFTWFSINYRLAPKHHWPAHIEDLNTAIAWVRAHAAEYKGDPNRIVLVGHSSGGHMVMYAATEPGMAQKVRGVVGFAPVTDLVSDSVHRGGVSQALQNLFGVTKEITPQTRARLAEVSPITHVHPGMPPILIVQGTKDRSVPYGMSVAFIDRLKETGVPCELITRQGVPHSLVQGEKIDTSYKAPLRAWLEKYVVNAK